MGVNVLKNVSHLKARILYAQVISISFEAIDNGKGLVACFELTSEQSQKYGRAKRSPATSNKVGMWKFIFGCGSDDALRHKVGIL
jgi:hypothetical protein